MRGKSHICLGKYLIKHYLSDVPATYTCAFLFGCLEPDRNPLTYLKGSVRYQWLRGHNYRNAKRFLHRISLRLEKKHNWNIFDYYTLGKLIHYTADAFTYAHNINFSASLSDHREYEVRLQEHFLEYIKRDPCVDISFARSVTEIMSSYHRLYEQQNAGIHIDSLFTLSACCGILALLISKPI